MRIPFYVRLCCSSFPGWVRKCRKLLIARRQKRTEGILAAVKQCATRSDLTRLLGDPVEIVVGDGCRMSALDGTVTKPETVEYYLYKGVTVALWFTKEEMISAFGSVEPTPFDVVCRQNSR
jgi:hypothetical protein